MSKAQGIPVNEECAVYDLMPEPQRTSSQIGVFQDVLADLRYQVSHYADLEAEMRIIHPDSDGKPTGGSEIWMKFKIPV